MTRIVINCCHGGFGLSQAAMTEYCVRKGINEISRRDIPRDDVDLVDIVETMGQDSWSRLAELKVVDIPDDVEWVIADYDGWEWVAEKHRTWR